MCTRISHYFGMISDIAFKEKTTSVGDQLYPSTLRHAYKIGSGIPLFACTIDKTRFFFSNQVQNHITNWSINMSVVFKPKGWQIFMHTLSLIKNYTLHDNEVFKFVFHQMNPTERTTWRLILVQCQRV